MTYKDGREWAEETTRTTGTPARLNVTTYQDRASVRADGTDLVFVSVAVVDENDDIVPDAEDSVTFSIDDPGVILTTDNGDQTDFVPFPEPERKAFSGQVLAIVRAEKGATGDFTVRATAQGVEKGTVLVSIQQ